MEEQIEKFYQEFKAFRFNIDPGLDEAFFKQQLKKMWEAGHEEGYDKGQEECLKAHGLDEPRSINGF